MSCLEPYATLLRDSSVWRKKRNTWGNKSTWICPGRRRNSRFHQDSRIGKAPIRSAPVILWRIEREKGNICVKPYVGQSERAASKDLRATPAHPSYAISRPTLFSLLFFLSLYIYYLHLSFFSPPSSPSLSFSLLVTRQFLSSDAVSGSWRFPYRLPIYFPYVFFLINWYSSRRCNQDEKSGKPNSRIPRWFCDTQEEISRFASRHKKYTSWI